MQSVIPAGRQKSEVELIFLKARVGLSLQGKESERFQQEIRTPEQAFSTQQKKCSKKKDELPSRTGRKRQHEMPHACQNARLNEGSAICRPAKGNERIQELLQIRDTDLEIGLPAISATTVNGRRTATINDHALGVQDCYRLGLSAINDHCLA
jgi:hypothetical protein